jgi:virginiamycin B lyase
MIGRPFLEQEIKRMQSKLLSIVTSAIFAGLLIAAPVQGQRGAPPVQLPAGPGQELVQSKCTQCHGLNLITGSAGFSKEGWTALIPTMVALPADQGKVIYDYLATNFPAKPDRRPSLVSGDASIKITEWMVPTLGQRSRDPIEAPDGSIWWTGMWASLVGRLDPKTGAMKEYPLPPTARPHSIVADKDGNIWYTGNSNATVGKLDPKTGKITEYKTKSRDPHSATFHPNGRLYFTAQGARMIGRLSPETGEITEVETEPNPYGIQVGPDGTLWVAHNGTNKVSSVHPDTLAIRFYEVPNTASRIRRLGFTSDGMVWYGNSIGRIGRLNPTTGEIKEWASPSGPTSSPYAFTVVNDVVWYNESGMRPDALVRFDPKTERFQSWAIPSGVGIVRNFGVTKAGNLLIHQTSSNRIGLVEINKK